MCLPTTSSPSMPPALLPHPDDVVIDDETGVRFIGPVDEAQAAKLDETIKVRDILIMQDALDRCLAEDPDGDDQPGSALLLAMILDKSVPARFRLAKAEWSERMIRYNRMPTRALLKTVYGAWKALGATGTKRPPAPAAAVGRAGRNKRPRTGARYPKRRR